MLPLDPPEKDFTALLGPLDRGIAKGDDILDRRKTAMQYMVMSSKIESKTTGSDNDTTLADFKKLSISEAQVAKVTPERIFSICMHPSEEKTLVLAGDKTGHLGLFNVDREDSDEPSVTWRLDTRPISSLHVMKNNSAKVWADTACMTHDPHCCCLFRFSSALMEGVCLSLMLSSKSFSSIDRLKKWRFCHMQLLTTHLARSMAAIPMARSLKQTQGQMHYMSSQVRCMTKRLDT